MRLSAAGLEAGAAAHLEPYVSANLKVLEQPAELLEPAEAGLRLACALIPGCGGQEAIESCALVAVEFEHPSETLTIPAEAVPHHLMASAWIGLSLGDVLGRALMTGAIWSHIGQNAPRTKMVELIEGAGCFFAKVRMVFPFPEGLLSVTARYGQAPASVAMSKALQVSGEALFLVGVTARQVTQAEAPSRLPAVPHEAIAAATVH